MWKRWTRAIREWTHQAPDQPRIGLALGGGFARCLAHVGVLQVFEEHKIPIHSIAGISSGSIIAAAYASGTPLEEMISAGACTTFSSYARWTLSKMGLASNERMDPYLRRVLRHARFEEMRTPLAVVATDLATGAPVVFKDSGDIIPAVRASCSYPGLFLPVEIDQRWLVDGAMSASVPTAAVAQLGATRVIGVNLPGIGNNGLHPTNMFQVVHRCIAIMQDRSEATWRRSAHLVIEPDVTPCVWNGFDRAAELVEAGRRAAERALPRIQAWLSGDPGPQVG